MFYADLAPRCFKKRKNFTPFNIEKIQTISSGEKTNQGCSLASTLQVSATLIILLAEGSEQTCWVVSGARALERDGDREKEEWANREFEILSWINKCFTTGFLGGQKCQKEKSRRFEVQEFLSSLWRKIMKVPDFPTFSPLPDIKFPDPVLLFTFPSLLKAEEKSRSHSQVWISEIHQGFSLFYQEFRLGTCWPVPIKIQSLLMAPGNTRIWCLQFCVSTWERAFPFRKLPCKSQIINRRNLCTKKPVSPENHSCMCLLSLCKLIFQLREMHHDLVSFLVSGKTNILSYPKFRII